MADRREMTEDEANEWFRRETLRTFRREDVQEFEQVHRAGGFHTKVWYRPLGFDFMAETTVFTTKGAQRRLVATGDSRSRCLERLAAHVLEWHHPSGDFRTKREAAHHYFAPEETGDG